MNEEILLKTIEELIKENKKLKQINNFLITSIEFIKNEAATIPGTNERRSMLDVCTGILLYVDMLTRKLNTDTLTRELDVEEGSFIRPNIKEEKE